MARGKSLGFEFSNQNHVRGSHQTSNMWKRASIHSPRSHPSIGISSLCPSHPWVAEMANLSGQDVRPLMEHYLSGLEIPVYIHDRHVPKGFVPEHFEAAPTNFEEFVSDIRKVVEVSAGRFSTLKTGQRFSVSASAARASQDLALAVVDSTLNPSTLRMLGVRCKAGI